MAYKEFLIGDNSDYPGCGFVVYTGYPQFIIDQENFELELLEEVDLRNEFLKSKVALLIEQATEIYNRSFL